MRLVRRLSKLNVLVFWVKVELNLVKIVLCKSRKINHNPAEHQHHLKPNRSDSSHQTNRKQAINGFASLNSNLQQTKGLGTIYKVSQELTKTLTHCQTKIFHCVRIINTNPIHGHFRNSQWSIRFLNPNSSVLASKIKLHIVRQIIDQHCKKEEDQISSPEEFPTRRQADQNNYHQSLYIMLSADQIAYEKLKFSANFMIDRKIKQHKDCSGNVIIHYHHKNIVRWFEQCCSSSSLKPDWNTKTWALQANLQYDA